MNIVSTYVGYVLDIIFGDPYCLPHPVIYIGKLIKFIENIIRNITKSRIGLKMGGLVLNFVVVIITYFTTYFILKISKGINYYLYIILNTLIIYTTLATKCLKDEAVKIYNVLKEGDIIKARKQLSYIVGRDTQSLSKNEIIRAVVETVAENTVDGIISPMFYLFIGGAPLAMAYKAVNTLDSMVGYKNEKYIDMGFASAKIDDIANFIPARITAFIMALSSIFLGFDYKNSIKIAIRDRKNHKSPNCAYPEGAVAGALRIQLGGTNYYFGEKVYKPTIGDKLREINEEDIIKTNKIMYLTSFLSLIIFSIIYITF
ncbi:adenosylcobinamide-phosphate synthase CbiB [Tepidibacter formicigenes]|jgi:adenosylcobinamide-phosphate synthase|uniref:Cobalamin biosynthesis protein CobD n=1 Tax=Tepidibacter formicigenes DSM 15518 TaxID=1123349 RepID=A0A1M6RI75_9FIRM|nr:adenosylcobinamide-phosphate synthase CbiB [Tepidibacter formicigenes]SHK32106.1 adenosylcobinamide-phosphate synthase [Tepidibacter formicigenes DSM 15518]